MRKSKTEPNRFFVKKYSSKVSIPIVILSIFLIHIVLNLIFIPLYIQSSSMEPSIDSNSYWIYTPLAVPGDWYPIAKMISRVSLVVLSPPYHQQPSLVWDILNMLYRIVTLNIGDLSSVDDGNPYMVRRVIGVPGDTIYMTNGVAHIQSASSATSKYFTSEFELSQKKYIVSKDTLSQRTWPNSLPLQGKTDSILLGPDEYFVLGDNRSIGNDSSYWGPITLQHIQGKLLFQYYSGKD